MRKPVLCRAAGEGLIIPVVQTLARGQSIVPSAKVSIAAGGGLIIPVVKTLERGQSIVPSAKVSIAFSALNSCSIITR